jgi:hypothetical protein
MTLTPSRHDSHAVGPMYPVLAGALCDVARDSLSDFDEHIHAGGAQFVGVHDEAAGMRVCFSCFSSALVSAW